MIYITILLFNGKINLYLNVIVNFLFVLIGGVLPTTFMHKYKVSVFLIGESVKRSDNSTNDLKGVEV